MLILGSGPNRIGQGIEFDYSCVHAATTLSEAGFETVMVNCNPETVSTDYDTADRLYFEPLTFEDVLEVYYAESASGAGGPGVVGVIVQLGGQTPLGLAERLEKAGVPIVGTSPKAIDLAEDRGAFGEVLNTAGLPAPRFGTATSFEQARRIAADIGYPVLVRPSYVLGGRGMEIVYDEDTLQGYITRATELSPEHPVLVDRFLEDAIEIDVDALCDGTEVYIGGIMEHIEEAGIHSGDSACALPPVTLGRSDIDIGATGHRGHRPRDRRGRSAQRAVRAQGRRALRAGGQPAASRTVPFVSKATAVPLAKACARIMLGATIAPSCATRACWRDRRRRQDHRAQRAGRGEGSGPAVPPVPQGRRRAGRLAAGPGDEVDRRGDGHRPRLRQRVRQEPDRRLRFAARRGHRVRVGGQPGQALAGLPGEAAGRPRLPVLATEGTAEMLRRNGIPCDEVRKHFEPPGDGGRIASAVDAIRAGEVDMVINTPYGNSGPRIDGYEIRSAAVAMNIPCVTTVQGASAAVQGIEAGIRGDIGVMSLQELHSALEAGGDARVRSAAGRRGVEARAALCLGSTRTRASARVGPVDGRDGLAKFCDGVVEAFAGFAVVKPQVAFFEAYGAAGFAVLERTIGALADAGVLVLADAKRGDIGSTMAAYADAWAGESPLAADAVTASPYLGFGSCSRCSTPPRHGRGVFVLAATSNPEGASVQRPTDRRAHRGAVDRRRRRGHQPPIIARARSVGVVVGAMSDPPDLSALGGPVLVPGVGAQDRTARSARRLRRCSLGDKLLCGASSRDVLRAGPEVSALRAAAGRPGMQGVPAIALI